MPSRRRAVPAFVSCACLVLWAWTAVGQDDPDGWKRPTEPSKIVGPIHYVGTYGLAAYLIETPAGHILIDGALPQSGPAIVSSLEAAGLRPRDVKFLVTTQAHFDHVGTLAHLRAQTGARVLAMRGDERLLTSGGKGDYLFGTQSAFHFPAVQVDQVIEDGHAITLGGVTLTAHRTPGHTPGTTTWTTTVQDGGRSYRVAFVGSTFVNPGTRLVKNPSYPGIEADYRRAFATLEVLPVDIPLGAHAQAFDFHGRRMRAKTEGVAAFVDRDALRKAVAASKAAFEKLVAAEKQ